MKRIISMFLVALLLLSCANIVCYASDNSTSNNISLESDFSDNRIIVVLDNETSLAFNQYNASNFYNIGCTQVNNLSTAAETEAQTVLTNIQLHFFEGEGLQVYDGVDLSEYRTVLCLELDTHSKENVIEKITKIKEMEGVEYVCPDYIIKACSTSTSQDPDSLDYADDGVDYLDLISLYDAWNITRGSSSVRVGVIDSGIDAYHDDLLGNVNTTLAKNYCGGYEDDDTEGLDSYGHGTKVAGIIAGKANNGLGIAGVCNDVELVSLIVMQNDGSAYASNAIMAFDEAKRIGCDIINLSLGWYLPELNDPDPHYNAVMSTTINNFGNLVVCAAGNDGYNIDDTISYPSSYHCSNVITVGASDGNDERWEETCDGKTLKSNIEKNTVDLFAPGYRILSTYPNSICSNTAIHEEVEDFHVQPGYHWDSGTSIATPFVTGVAVLMLSINPNLTAAQLKDIIVRTVDYDPNSELVNYCISGGRLNAYKAVSVASDYRFDYNYSYSSIDENTHGVICDTCECNCRTADYSCNACDFGCDPCEDCHIYYTLLHFWQYSATDSLTSHTKYCRDCGYTTTSAHDWVETGTAYQCTLCKKIAITIPEIAAYLPPDNDEELTE